MSDEATKPTEHLTLGEKLAGQIINVLDTQHPEINWPFETMAGLINQGVTFTGRDFIAHREEKEHPPFSTCPGCAEDCSRVAMVDLIYTFVACQCERASYAHLVEQIWHKEHLGSSPAIIAAMKKLKDLGPLVCVECNKEVEPGGRCPDHLSADVRWTNEPATTAEAVAGT